VTCKSAATEEVIRRQKDSNHTGRRRSVAEAGTAAIDEKSMIGNRLAMSVRYYTSGAII